MPSNQYYSVAVASFTSQVAATELSAVAAHAITYTKQRVGVVYQSATVFVGTGTQVAYVAQFTTAIIPSVAQLL